jgi:hypothetical protein
MTPLSTYLNRLFALHAGAWATTERSYHPALAELFNAIGGALSPKVTAIAEVADHGGGACHVPFTSFHTPASQFDE